MTDHKLKVWPRYYQMMVDDKKDVDLRLADFDNIEAGDWVTFKEWDPHKEEYTGRMVSRLLRRVSHVNLTDFHTIEEVAEHGHYILEFGPMSPLTREIAGMTKEVREWEDSLR